MKVIFFGKIPPPMGGVTVSVKNLIVALASKNIEVDILGKGMSHVRYDLAHVHYSSLLKRFLGLVLARFLAKKVIFTVHGKFLDMDNIYNKLSAKLSHGVIVLNDKLLKQLSIDNPEINCCLLPSIFVEGFDGAVGEEVYFEKDTQYKYLLLYAFDKNFKDEHEVYGVTFILENLHRLDKKYKIVLLDINAKYADDVAPYLDRVVYLDRAVNFVSLLSQVDIYLRPTFMDGASVAVQEALVMNVPVLASDVVDRPEGTSVYRYLDVDDFIAKLAQTSQNAHPSMELQSVDEYLQFCEHLRSSVKSTIE